MPPSIRDEWLVRERKCFLLPRPCPDAECDEVRTDVAPVEQVRVAEPTRDLIPVPLAAERVARVEVVVTDVAGRPILVRWIARDPCIHRILLASVKMIDP